MLEANFWQDKEKSKKILKEKKLLEEMSSSYLNIENELKDAEELFELANNEKNLEILSDLTNTLKILKKTVKQNEIKCFLSNEADSLDTYIEIHAGAGGTESQDWA